MHLQYLYFKQNLNRKILSLKAIVLSIASAGNNHRKNRMLSYNSWKWRKLWRQSCEKEIWFWKWNMAADRKMKCCRKHFRSVWSSGSQPISFPMKTLKTIHEKPMNLFLFFLFPHIISIWRSKFGSGLILPEKWSYQQTFWCFAVTAAICATNLQVCLVCNVYFNILSAVMGWILWCC